MSKEELRAIEQIEQVTSEAIQTVDNIVSKTGTNFEKLASPVRKKILKHHPALYLLLVTFGLVATSIGIEQILLQYPIFLQHPWLLLLLGLLILVFTGTLYKRLDSV